jgi:hypothetical protein
MSPWQRPLKGQQYIRGDANYGHHTRVNEATTVLLTTSCFDGARRARSIWWVILVLKMRPQLLESVDVTVPVLAAVKFVGVTRMTPA